MILKLGVDLRAVEDHELVVSMVFPICRAASPPRVRDGDVKTCGMLSMGCDVSCQGDIPCRSLCQLSGLPSGFHLRRFDGENCQDYKTEQGIPKLVPKHECPQRGSRIVVQGLEDLRDDRWNGEKGTIQGERNGRWVVRCVRVKH